MESMEEIYKEYADLVFRFLLAKTGNESLSEELTIASAEETVLKQQERVSIMKALHAVPEPYKEVLYLRIFGNLSFREIGEIMEKTENWARVTFYRGKEKLRWEE